MERPYPPPGGIDKYTRIDELLVQNIEATRNLAKAVDSLKSQQDEMMRLQRGFDTPFDTLAFDLTSAVTDKRVVFPPCQFIQAVADGELYGVTIKLARQDAYPIDLSKLDTIAVGNARELYLTNDVRAGRSKLWLYFHRLSPFGRHYTGDPVSHAELAARLGSIVSFDRRGDVVWLDNFEDNLNKWFCSSVGAGASITLSADAARNGALSAKLTTGNVINDYAQILRHFPRPVLSNIGFEVSFTVAENTKYVIFVIAFEVASIIYIAVIRYDYILSKLYYRNSAGGYTELDPVIGLYASTVNFNTIKIVVDLNNKKYVRLLLNERAYDLSAYGIYSIPGVGIDFLRIEALVQANANANVSIYLDDAIITQNEP